MEDRYTVISEAGIVIRRHLTAVDAADEILMHDGHSYEIRRADDGQGFELWVSKFSRASPLGGKPLVKSQIFSLAEDEDTAQKEIAGLVITARWRGYPEAIKDTEYDSLGLISQ